MKAIMDRAVLRGEKLKAECYHVRTHHILIQDKNGIYHDCNFCLGNGTECRMCNAHIIHKDEWIGKVRGYDAQ